MVLGHAELNRRALVNGAIAFVGSASLPTAAEAFLPAFIEALEAVVAIWEGIKMVKEVYDTFFGERQQPVNQEVSRFLGPRNFTIDDYYRFGNSYRAEQFEDQEPGCAASSVTQRNSGALCCAAQERTILVPAGCVVALHSAVSDMRGSISDNNIFAYTRPVRYVTPVLPWQSFDASGGRVYSDVKYYSVSGSVALRWLITDRSSRTCVGQYRIRDDYSNRIVAEGQTNHFYF